MDYFSCLSQSSRASQTALLRLPRLLPYLWITRALNSRSSLSGTSMFILPISKHPRVHTPKYLNTLRYIYTPECLNT